MLNKLRHLARTVIFEVVNNVVGKQMNISYLDLFKAFDKMTGWRRKVQVRYVMTEDDF